MRANSVPLLSDHTGRTVNYLRISVTDRCNLRCTYCMPPAVVSARKDKRLLRYEEMTRLIEMLLPLGISKIRITGGEPLVRKDLPLFIEMIKKSAPHAELCMTTNGILVTRYLEDLRKAGIDRFNVSLDTLKADRFRKITGYDLLDQVLEGINGIIAKELFPLKLNVLLIPGVNSDEIESFIEFARTHPVEVRFIEKMPIGSLRDTGFVPVSKVEAALWNKYGEVRGRRARGETSLQYDLKGFAGKIGLIAPLSRTFCSDCNRLRITAGGEILNCLLNRTAYDVGSALENGSGDSEIMDVIKRALSEKPARYDQGYLFRSGQMKRCMTSIGG
ncbi:MAG: GTP 3',8-cyclase MoaA [Deltaproteobacteria bacterium]|nr:GTP 3',8-cyclase MoaA [Deltaproteobacteria bacterium]NIS77482.1 GTP 3',8-cyclase MoaA [Deltaproteobacteria bacterium]